MSNPLSKLLGAAKHNFTTNVKGAYNELNVFDHGKTFADANRSSLPTNGVWAGISGGDQAYVPYQNLTHNADPGFRLPIPSLAKLLKVATPIPQQQLQVTNNYNAQSLGGEDSPMSDILLNTSYNNGQVTYNGQGIQGSLRPGLRQYSGFNPAVAQTPAPALPFIKLKYSPPNPNAIRSI